MKPSEEVLVASTRELRERIVRGHPVDPAELEGWAYRGTSLGLPRFVEKLTWKTFQKTFWRDPLTGRLLGWNVRLEQRGVGAPSVPLLRDGKPVTEWHYEVLSPRGIPTPPGFDRGLLIDYSRGQNPLLEPTRLGKDPLVALEPGNSDALLGVTYLVLAGRCVETPTYFLLEREHPLTFVPYLEEPGAKPSPSPTRLRAFERAWAEALFEAVLPGGEGLPRFAETDRETFWRCLEEAPASTFGLGLRGMVYALNFLPATNPRYLRPFHQLDAEQRERFLAELASRPGYAPRQVLTTFKTLACMAYFDDPAVRAAVGADPPGSKVEA